MLSTGPIQSSIIKFADADKGEGETLIHKMWVNELGFFNPSLNKGGNMFRSSLQESTSLSLTSITNSIGKFLPIETRASYTEKLCFDRACRRQARRHKALHREGVQTPLRY